jgi:hypothetical protein
VQQNHIAMQYIIIVVQQIFMPVQYDNTSVQHFFMSVQRRNSLVQYVKSKNNDLLSFVYECYLPV